MSATKPRRAAPERGFTLVELMVVITIIGLISTVVMMNLMGRLLHAKQQKVRADVRQIDGAITTWRLEHDAPPAALADLIAPSPAGTGAILDGGSEALRDPWGRDYVYAPEGGSGSRPYTLGSYGADGQPGGTGADVDIFPLEGGR